MKSIPKVDVDQHRLDSIPGNVPMPGSVKQGCRFASRCLHVEAKCLTDAPPLFELAGGQQSRCWLHEGSAEKEVAHA
jgi:peptide/nickel transport system ATP-binding protein